MTGESKASVLIVEDDPYLNLAIAETLRSYDFSVEQVYNGLEALQSVRARQPDVIVCDINMPVMDGYTFLQHTRADPELRLLPFIFLTARTTTEDQRRAKAIGVEDYLSKPVDSSDLVAAIENAVKRRRLMLAELERNMDTLRNRIVGLLQHEFRTPLTFILGYAELLASSNTDQIDINEMRLAADAILDGGHRLQHLIESFLLLAELQSRTLNPQDLDLVQAWSLWRDTLQELDLSGVIGPLPVRLLDQHDMLTVRVDLRLLDKALHRLFEYVLRVRHPGATEIVCSIDERFPYVGLKLWCDWVNPPPLPPSDHYVGASTDNRSKEEMDTDLGLTLAHHVATLHAGSLAIDHGERGDATFILWLPLADQTEDQ